jgi:hypothetical protein
MTHYFFLHYVVSSSVNYIFSAFPQNTPNLCSCLRARLGFTPMQDNLFLEIEILHK